MKVYVLEELMIYDTSKEYFSKNVKIFSNIASRLSTVYKAKYYIYENTLYITIMRQNQKEKKDKKKGFFNQMSLVI